MYICNSVTLKKLNCFHVLIYTDFMLTDLIIYINYSFFSLVLIQFISKCNNNNNIIGGCSLAPT